jgi:hypothetical protein
MMTVDYFLLCETVVRDTAGRLTLVNVFDALNIPQFPATPAKFALIFRVYPKASDIKDGKLQFKMEIVGPSGKVAASISGSGDVDADTVKNHRSVVAAADLAAQVPIEGPGRYKVVLSINDEVLKEIPLEVNHKPQEQE